MIFSTFVMTPMPDISTEKSMELFVIRCWSDISHYVEHVCNLW